MMSLFYPKNIAILFFTPLLFVEPSGLFLEAQSSFRYSLRIFKTVFKFHNRRNCQIGRQTDCTLYEKKLWNCFYCAYVHVKDCLEYITSYFISRSFPLLDFGNSTWCFGLVSWLAFVFSDICLQLYSGREQLH